MKTTASHASLLRDALFDWRSGRAFIRKGRYWLRPLEKVGGSLTVGWGRATLAPWSRAALAEWGDSDRLYDAAEAAYPGVRGQALLNRLRADPRRRRPLRRDVSPHRPPPRPLPVGHAKRWVQGFEHFASTEGGHAFDAWLEGADLTVRVRTPGGFLRKGVTFKGSPGNAENAARSLVRGLLASDPFKRNDPKRRTRHACRGARCACKKSVRHDAVMSASDWSREMARLRTFKPRPLHKRYGQNPTEEQRRVHKEEERVWNRAYRAASASQKKQLVIDNAAYRARSQ